LIAFAASTVVGFAVGNDIFTVLWRGLVIMLGCYVVGRMIGSVAQWTIDSHIERYKEQHPIPQESDNTEANKDTSSRAAA